MLGSQPSTRAWALDLRRRRVMSQTKNRQGTKSRDGQDPPERNLRSSVWLSTQGPTRVPVFHMTAVPDGRDLAPPNPSQLSGAASSRGASCRTSWIVKHGNPGGSLSRSED